jgi:hypothetical protein
MAALRNPSFHRTTTRGLHFYVCEYCNGFYTNELQIRYHECRQGRDAEQAETPRGTSLRK